MTHSSKIAKESLHIEKVKPRYLNKDDAGNYLGVSKRMMTRLVDERRIKFYRVGRFVRFRIEDLDTFAASGLVEAG
jgi:excisionase family DNA binding protein